MEASATPRKKFRKTYRQKTTKFYKMRIKRNLSLEELSELSNIPVSTLKSYDYGNNRAIYKAQVGRILTLCDIFRCSPMDIIEMPTPKQDSKKENYDNKSDQK